MEWSAAIAVVLLLTLVLVLVAKAVRARRFPYRKKESLFSNAERAFLGVLRTVRKGGKKGLEFWGCAGFPKCRGVLPVSMEPGPGQGGAAAGAGRGIVPRYNQKPAHARAGVGYHLRRNR